MIPFLGNAGQNSSSTATDPYFSSVVLLCHCDGTNGSTTITDQKGHTVTANGNAQLSTSVFKFGSASVAFDGTGDYLSIPDSADWNLGTGDWTVEMWVYLNNVTARHGIFGQTVNSNNYSEFALRFDSAVGSKCDVFSGGSPLVNCNQGSTSGWSINTWYSICWERSGNTVRGYRDGAVVATHATGGFTYPDYAASLCLGVSQQGVNNFYLNGYLDEIRVTKGVARYSGAYTPSTTAFPDA